MADTNLIYGHHPVTEAIRAGKPVEKVFFQQGERGEMEKEIRHLTKEYGIPLQVVPKEKLNKMVKGNHQIGIAATLHLTLWYSQTQSQDLTQLQLVALQRQVAPDHQDSPAAVASLEAEEAEEAEVVGKLSKR